jgi:methanogenic corrinoid protein MtbC1
MRDYSEQGTDRREYATTGGLLDREPQEPCATPTGDERMARLVRTIEGEIVPRLVMARRVTSPGEAVKERAVKAPDGSDVKELVRLLLAHDVAVASGYVEAVRARGATLEMVCLELLAPAARELGLMWEKDECDFMQVTVGLCRLHQLLREISGEFRPEPAQTKADRNILLATIPGEQHTFGIMLVAQFLRRAGWDVWHEFPDTAAAILDLVRQHRFAVVGLSVGCDTRLDDVASIIRAVRVGSRNQAVGILVGGPLLNAKPDAAKLVGADATAIDGREAVEQADYICSRRGAIN